MGKTTFGTICLVALLFALTGCGSVDWFPKYVRPPTTPDPFTFTAQANVAVNAPITSNSITVSGLTADSSPISITGTASNSQFSINGATATSVATNVKNGDQVTVIQTSAATPDTTTTSTLTIGNVNGTFALTTELVVINPFSTATLVGGFAQAFATLTSFDGIAGTHLITITDSANSGNAQFSVGDINGNPTIFTTAPQTVPILNGLRIFVRNLSSTTNVTTLTIDGASSNVTLTTP